jgi:hypothetical protein
MKRKTARFSFRMTRQDRVALAQLVEAENQEAPVIIGRLIRQAAKQLKISSRTQSMELTGPQQQQLQQALLSAFPKLDWLRQMVAFSLNENLDAIAVGDDLATVVFNLIIWAIAQGRLEDLLIGAYQRNPGNPALYNFLCNIRLNLV